MIQTQVELQPKNPLSDFKYHFPISNSTQNFKARRPVVLRFNSMPIFNNERTRLVRQAGNAVRPTRSDGLRLILGNHPVWAGRCAADMRARLPALLAGYLSCQPALRARRDGRHDAHTALKGEADHCWLNMPRTIVLLAMRRYVLALPMAHWSDPNALQRL